MQANGFETPEEAMMVGFPPRYCYVVATATNGDDAYVLIQTGSNGTSYLYGGWCHRIDGRWHEGGSSNGGGWQSCVDSEDEDIGHLAFWDEAPSDAEAARVEHNGASQEVPVQHGAFLAVWWRVSSEHWAHVASLKINGEWSEPSLFNREGIRVR